jgi:AcrR family transcriptional regulator
MPGSTECACSLRLETVHRREGGGDALRRGGTRRRRHRHVYHNFPTRDALAEAVYRHEVARLSEAAPALLKRMPTDKGLEDWLTRYAGLIAAKRGMKEAVRSIFEPDVAAYAYSRGRLTAAVTLLLDAAAKSGAMRGDVDPQDALLAVAASTWAFANDSNWQERAGPVLRLVMDGLGYKPR